MILWTEMGVQLTVALGFHINTFTYGLSGPQIAILAVALLLSAIVAQPRTGLKLSRRFDKKPALYAAIALAAIGLVGAPMTHVAWHWFPLEPSAHLVATLLPFQILAGPGQRRFLVTALRHGHRLRARLRRSPRQPDGYLYRAVTFRADKLGGSLSIAGSGVLLSFIGYQSNTAVQSAATRYDLAGLSRAADRCCCCPCWPGCFTRIASSARILPNPATACPGSRFRARSTSLC